MRGTAGVRRFKGSFRRLSIAGLLPLLAALGALPGLALGASTGGLGTPPPPPKSAKLATNLCKTVGGGRFVPIPGFPGEKIDVRLLPDVRWMVRRFHIFISDGYSRDPVHEPRGEHPLGLALDISPGPGGSWAKVTRLARLAEPRQNRPRAPFRWVGYRGDAGHGPHHHLHLSWSHSPAKPGHPARTVYTRICPA